jgi:RNA polymerase sigma-70 factor (ECF subfamily)
MLLAGVSYAQSVAGVSVRTMPPSVVETFPRAGDVEVDPSTSEIRVTFSKDMKTDNQWSWVMMSKETFPEIAGEVRYLPDRRTCVLPVRLVPGRTYVIWLNSGDYNYFKDEGGRSAIPYLLVFQTK